MTTHHPTAPARRSVRPLWLLIGLAAVAGASLLAWRTTRPEAPLAPLPAGLVPSAEFLNAEDAIAYYRERVRRNPDEVVSWTALAQVLLQHARETGREAEFVPEAQAALDEALERAPADVHARLLRASLLTTLHRFEDARTLARGLIAEYPRQAFAYGVLTDALVELGEYDAAVAAADSMVAIRPGVASYSRVSYLRELHGDADGAIQAMAMAAEAGLSGRAERAWALYHLAELHLGAGHADTAAVIFEGILDEKPDFADALAGLGHAALVRGDTDAAIRLIEQAHGMIPRDAFLETLAEAYAVRGDAARARQMNDRVLEGLRANREMGEIVDMEEADLLADLDRELPRALSLAEAQVRRRPGHLHALETYAWTLHKNGRSREAVGPVEQAMRLNTGDAMVHWRAAQIYAAVGRRVDAARHTQLALDGNLHVESPTAAAEARERLADLGSAPVAVVRFP